MSRHLSSEAVTSADLALNLGLVRLGAGDGARDQAAAEQARTAGLGAGQADAIAALCGRRALEVVIGPAGSGNTTMLGVVKDRLDAEGRQLLVVAPTLRAAQVASGELGAEASSLHRLLYAQGWRWDELGRFSRLAPARQIRPPALFTGARPGASPSRPSRWSSSTRRRSSLSTRSTP